jgi:hypothetical protein
MTKNERTVINTVWSYLRDHAKTPEQIALKDSLSKILVEDMKRRKKRGGIYQ